MRKEEARRIKLPFNVRRVIIQIKSRDDASAPSLPMYY
jgi:hypothetical protein